MRCKKHPIDLSSRVGVCASCLRERLFTIMAAQAQAQALKQDCRKSDTQPPPLLPFPRSVSPYISGRKSDTNTATWKPHDHRRFYSTPQIGPTGSIKVEIENTRKTSKGRGISSLLGFFRSKSENKPDSVPDPIYDPRVLINSCSATSSWFSNFIPGARKKKIQTILIDEYRNRGRGMSPTRHADNEDEHCQSSGYSSDSQGWKQTPRRTPASRRRGGGHSKSVSGLAFCLSPLVRPSPNLHRNQKGIPPEMVVTGECRTTPNQHPSITASLCKNRSRKLAGFGRYTYDPTH